MIDRRQVNFPPGDNRNSLLSSSRWSFQIPAWGEFGWAPIHEQDESGHHHIPPIACSVSGEHRGIRTCPDLTRSCFQKSCWPSGRANRQRILSGRQPRSPRPVSDPHALPLRSGRFSAPAAPAVPPPSIPAFSKKFRNVIKDRAYGDSWGTRGQIGDARGAEEEARLEAARHWGRRYSGQAAEDFLHYSSPRVFKLF